MHALASPLGRPLLDAPFRADPYPTYAALREAGPIHWSDEFFGGAWLLTRHADVEAVLRDSVRFSAQRTGGWVMGARAAEGATGIGIEREVRDELKGFQALFARAMLFVDAPDHGRLRSAMNAGFRADAIERLRPAVERWVGERLDAVEDQARSADGFDFIAAIARPLPAQVIAALLGVDEDAAGRAAFTAWSDDLATFIGATQPTLTEARRAQASLLAMAASFEPLIQARRAMPRDDLVSRLVQAEREGRIGSGAELLAQCAMLLFAGHETTRNLLGNGLLALLERSATQPAAWARLRAEPALLPGAVRELLRYDSPVQYTGRRVATDLVLHGQQLRRGDLVIALIASANRDPLRFDHPDELDLARRSALPLSFGVGPHVCIGATLTLMEAQVVFGAMLRRWPLLRVVEGAGNEAPAWLANPVYRGLASLPVSVGVPR